MIGYDPYNQDPSNFTDPLAQQLAQPVSVDNTAPAIPMQAPTLNQRFNSAVSGGLGRISQGLFPVDQSLPPDQAKALQSSAMMRMGLGMLGAASSGARFGRALNAGYTGASNELQGAMQNAYHNALAKKQDDRAQTLMENTLENTKVDNVRQQQQVDAQVEANKLAQKDREAQQQALNDYRDRELKIRQQELDQRASANQATPMSPDELDMAATTVMTDPNQMRQYASFGKVGQQRRDQINEAMAHKLKDAGMTPSDLGQIRANFKAQGASINKAVPQLQAIQAFESLAKANGQRILDLIDKVDNTGVPLIEGYSRRLKRSAGDPDAAELASVFQTFQMEASRILSNPNMTGVVTDSARHEVQAMSPSNMNAAQAKRVINRLFTEMDLRRSFLQQSIDQSGQAMKAAGQPAAPAPAAPMAPAANAGGWSIRPSGT